MNEIDRLKRDMAKLQSFIDSLPTVNELREISYGKGKQQRIEEWWDGLSEYWMPLPEPPNTQPEKKE